MDMTGPLMLPTPASATKLNEQSGRNIHIRSNVVQCSPAAAVLSHYMESASWMHPELCCNSFPVTAWLREQEQDRG